ncbi:amino acid ABC transporter permease [Candidatus Berkiella cookevillensis]|uniref:Amino acid ABC transporter permease n=1 Tax=Candidatus Berkiella cookevillensis TaxID=437022 RepID=A0A0Q9YCM2_9GAMM|nr:amino acid ABC transporter permease [Candidatus Berkiella cookevillensis]MCS5708095.1 amino acid ABC transporter permease [Candidatus Berkiella cookevillensis]
MIDGIQNILFIGAGIYITLKILLGSVLLGLTMGTFIAILRYKNICLSIIKHYISIIRGTPVILQLSFIYFSVPTLTGFKLSIVSAGILSFGVNSSAYIAEILRSGIESLPAGQFEASKTLQIPSFYMWKDIILPQVFRNIFPAMINQSITLLKETALISTIGGMDLMRRAQSLAAEQFTYFMPMCIAACYYYGLILLIEYVSKKFEERSYHVKHS